MVSSLPLKWMDFIPSPLLFNSLLSKALDARNIGCPLWAKLSIMSSAVWSPCPSGLLTWVPFHFFSDPGPGNDQCPRVNLRAYSVTLWAFAIQVSLVPRFLQSMSLYIDMKWNNPVHTLIQSSFFEFRQEFQCSEYWEICPLEFHGFTVDPIQVFNIACFHKPFHLTFPGFDWFVTDTSQTEHWVRKDVSIGICKLNSSVSQQSSSLSTWAAANHSL